MKVLVYVLIAVLTICYLIVVANNERERNKPTHAKLLAPVLISLALLILWFITIYISDHFNISITFMYISIVSFIYNYIELNDYKDIKRRERRERRERKSAVQKDAKNNTAIQNDQVEETKS